MNLKELKDKYFQKDNDVPRESIIIAMRADPDFTEEVEFDEGGRKTLLQARERLIDDYADTYFPTRASAVIVVEKFLNAKISNNWDKLCEYADQRAKFYEEEEKIFSLIGKLPDPELFFAWLNNMMLCPQNEMDTSDMIRQFQEATLGDEEEFKRLFPEEQWPEAFRSGYYQVQETFFAPN